MTPEQRANLDHGSEEYNNRVWGSKIQVIGWSLYAAILWCLKLCIAAVYARLTYGRRKLFAFRQKRSFANIRFSGMESPTWRFAYAWRMAFCQRRILPWPLQSYVPVSRSTISGRSRLTLASYARRLSRRLMYWLPLFSTSSLICICCRSRYR
jgi:hypothetical protein